MGLTQRSGQVDASLAAEGWLRFERQCANDLQLLHLSPAAFGDAAALIREPLHGLRAGDGLHLAVAVGADVAAVATLDENFANSARRLKLKLALRSRRTWPLAGVFGELFLGGSARR